MRKQLGFTLIELMISMFIMSILTILVSTTVRTSVQNKKKLEARMNSETLLYDTMRVIRLDLERAFNYQDIFYQMEIAAIQQAQNVGRAPAPGQPPPGGGQIPGAPVVPPPGFAGGPGAQIPLPPPPVRLTHFLGESDSLHFTNLNHYRTQYDAKESDQMEVGFFVESCQRRIGKKKGSTRCLWRRSTPQIDDRVDEGGTRVVVAESVQNFTIRYRSDRENDQWVEQWRSDNRGRPDHQNKFPHFVKVTLEIGEKDNPELRPVGMTMIVRIPFPNNETLNLNVNPNQANPPTGTP